MIDNTTLNYWPLVLVIEDVYVPELVETAMAGAEELGNENLAAIITTAAYGSYQDALRRQN